MAYLTEDPKDVVTPDAFTVSKDLLGLPLARPWRRASAMLIDLAFVGLLTTFFGFTVLVLLGGLVFFRAARTPADGGLLRRSVSLTLRFWGIVFLLIFVWQAMGVVRRALPGGSPPAATRTAPSTITTPGMPPMPDFVEQTLAEAGVTLDMGDTVADTTAGAPERTAEQERIATLERRVVQLQQQNQALREDQPRGMRRMLAALGDDMGLGFGWLALYFTAFTVLGSGRTPGKLFMRIRVIRLTGEPLTWWISFERFGGYAASFSTGLLGFLQILWDRNRQGLHDKAVETVVVSDAPSVPPHSVRSDSST